MLERLCVRNEKMYHDMAKGKNIMSRNGKPPRHAACRKMKHYRYYINHNFFFPSFSPFFIVLTTQPCIVITRNIFWLRGRLLNHHLGIFMECDIIEHHPPATTSGVTHIKASYSGIVLKTTCYTTIKICQCLLNVVYKQSLLLLGSKNINQKRKIHLL